MKRYLSFAVLLAAAAITACNYDKNGIQDITGPLPASKVMFFNFGMGSPGVNFYANDTKMTAVLSTSGAESTTGVGYTGVGAGGLYAGIEPGSYTLSGRIAATTDNGLSISTLGTTLVAGKNYSFYQSGLYNTDTKKVDSFIVEDPFPAAIDFSTSFVRLVNAVYNSTGMTLYAKNKATGVEAAVGGAVSYKAAGTFTAVPGAVYDLSTRVAGSSASAIARTSVSFEAGKVYTIGARGDMTVTGTTALNRPFLDVTANR